MNQTERCPPDLPPKSLVVDLVKRLRPAPQPSRLARLFGARVQWDYRIGDLIPLEEAGFFKTQRVFIAYGETDLLPHRCLPNGSLGYFAFDGRVVRMIGRSLPSLSKLFAAERRPLQEADPVPLAQFICDVALPRDGSGHSVVAAVEDIEQFGRSDSFGGDYRVNRVKLDRVRDLIEPPAVLPHERGWTLRFTTLYGWMHEKQELGVERLEVSPMFEFQRSDRQVLARGIFAGTPSVIY